MARLWSSGFELNSTTTGMEFTTIYNGPSISTSVVRSGTYSGRINVTTDQQWFGYTYKADTTTAPGKPIYLRIYLRIAAYPSANTELIAMDSDISSIWLTTTGRLQLFDVVDTYSQLGSDSDVLSLDTWYRIEMKVDSTTISSTALEAKLNGTSFASGTADYTGASGWGAVSVGVVNYNASADLYLDDFAINDNAGSFQNSYPGEGEIIHLRPSGIGDNGELFKVPNAGEDQWQNVDEVTPDDVTTYNYSDFETNVDDHNIDNTPAALATDDVINVVQVGVRYAGESASDNASFQVRLKKASGGTISSGAAITPASTTWVTNANVAPKNYPLTLYQDPDSSNWTKATLDTAQIGAIISTSNTNAAYISTLWLLVEHRAAGASASPSASPSQSPSASVSPSASPSVSPSASVSPSRSPSVSPSASASPSISPSVSPSVSPSASRSPSISPSISPSVSPSASVSPSISPSPAQDILSTDLWSVIAIAGGGFYHIIRRNSRPRMR